MPEWMKKFLAVQIIMATTFFVLSAQSSSECILNEEGVLVLVEKTTRNASSFASVTRNDIFFIKNVKSVRANINVDSLIRDNQTLVVVMDHKKQINFFDPSSNFYTMFFDSLIKRPVRYTSDSIELRWMLADVFFKVERISISEYTQPHSPSGGTLLYYEERKKNLMNCAKVYIALPLK
jgi:hypothetical protein